MNYPIFAKITLFAAFIALILISLSYADMLYVTVAYDKGAVSIKHIEVFAGDADGSRYDGEYVLDYEVKGGYVFLTTFDIPRIQSTGDQMKVLDYAEQTITVPLYPGAENISVYSRGATRLAYLSFIGVSKPGDAKGIAPEGSIAARTGQTSIATAVQTYMYPSTPTTTVKTGQNTSTSTSDQNKEQNENGACLVAFIPPGLLGLALFYQLRMRKEKAAAKS